MPPSPVSSDPNGARGPLEKPDGSKPGWLSKIFGLFALRRPTFPTWEGMEAIESIKLLQLPDIRAQFGLDADQDALLLALPGQISKSDNPVQGAAIAWRDLQRSQLLSADDERLLQKLVWQRRGEAALANPAFRARLRLSRRQGDAIESILESARAELDSVSHDSERPLVKEKLGKEMMEILSAEQVRIWKYLIATPAT